MQIEYAKVSALGDRQDNQDRAAVVVSDSLPCMLCLMAWADTPMALKAAETGLKGRAGALHRCAPADFRSAGLSLYGAVASP